MTALQMLSSGHWISNHSKYSQRTIIKYQHKDQTSSPPQQTLGRLQTARNSKKRQSNILDNRFVVVFHAIVLCFVSDVQYVFHIGGSSNAWYGCNIWNETYIYDIDDQTWKHTQAPMRTMMANAATVNQKVKLHSKGDNTQNLPKSPWATCIFRLSVSRRLVVFVLRCEYVISSFPRRVNFFFQLSS